MQWYIHFQGQKEGPFSPEEFRQRLANLASRDQVFVWRTGMDGWKKVQDVPEIALMNAQPSADAAKPGQQDLSVLMEMPNLVDEKTRVLDTQKIKALTKEAKQAEKVANKARAQATTDVAEAPSGAEGKRGSGLVKKIGFVLIAVALVGGGIFAYPLLAKPHPRRRGHPDRSRRSRRLQLIDKRCRPSEVLSGQQSEGHSSRGNL